jgi:VanZ family protein
MICGKKNKLKIIRVTPALLLTSFISWIIFQANTGRNNIIFELVNVIPYGDKISHFILYGTLSLLTVIALNYRCIKIKRLSIPLGAIVVLFVAILEEITQLFVSNRTFEIADISADIAGIFVFIYLFNKLKK